jgi:hypothetical protein
MDCSAQLAANRTQSYRDFAAGLQPPQDGASLPKPSSKNWWRQGTIGGAKAHGFRWR